MSDAVAANTPFAAATPRPHEVDPLAGDWAEGLRGPVRALGLVEPRLITAGPAPSAPPPAVSAPPVAAEEVEAPDAWAAAEDPLQSRPAPVVIAEAQVIFSEPPPAKVEAGVVELKAEDAAEARDLSGEAGVV